MDNLSDSQLQKSALRRSLLKTRQSLSPEAWQSRSQRLCDRLRDSDLFNRAETILSYCSTRQEPDLSFLWPLPKTWGLPRCVGSSLQWHHWSAAGSFPLQTGAFGIQEPDPASPQLSAEQVDLLLVPCIACDRRGYRLGYGGGFYDRLLSSPPWQGKPAIGIVFEFACLPELPIDSWDQRLQAICTESGLFFCNP